MQPFSLNEKKWKKAKVVKPLERRSFVVESGVPLYIRNRGYLKRSAEADSPLAEESQRPWSPMISQLWNGWQQPVLTNPLSTTVVSDDQAPTGNNDQSSRTTHPIVMPSSQQASPKGSESQVRTRSGRLVRPPNHFKNCVALKGTNK